MFLIIVNLHDDIESELVFIVEPDPYNKKIPNQLQIYERIDEYFDPLKATIRFGEVTSQFLLFRTKRDGFELSSNIDDIDLLKPCKFSADILELWEVYVRKLGDA